MKQWFLLVCPELRSEWSRHRFLAGDVVTSAQQGTVVPAYAHRWWWRRSPQAAPAPVTVPERFRLDLDRLPDAPPDDPRAALASPSLTQNHLVVSSTHPGVSDAGAALSAMLLTQLSSSSIWRTAFCPRDREARLRAGLRSRGSRF